jgi:copper transport protein
MGRFLALGGRARPALLTLLVGVLATGALVLAAGPADAHAVLESTAPADGDQLDAAPGQVVLRFSESVSTPDDGIVVYAGSGDPLDIGEPSHPDGDGSAVAVDLPGLEDGAYVVSYRVISSDSHPVSGAFTFTVGDVDPAEAQALQASLGGGTGGDDTVGIVYGIARFLAFAGLILLIGGAAFVLGVWPDGLASRRVRRLVRTGWALAVVATAACIGLQGAYGAGLSLGDALDPSVIGDELGARAGRVWLIRLVLLAVVALAASAYLRRRPAPGAPASASAAPAAETVEAVGPVEPVEPEGGEVAAGGTTTAPATEPGSGVAVAERGDSGTSGTSGNGVRAAAGGGAWGPLDEVRYVGAVLGLALLATISFAGHAGAGRWLVVALVADVVHLAGVSVWLGGLAVLAVVVLRRDTAGLDPGGLERVVSRFSEVAFVAVLVIVASGVVQAWRQLDGFDALTGTSYGRLLIAKVALVAAMVGAAGVSRAWLRGWFLAATDRAAKAAGTAPGPGGHRSDLYLLRQSVGLEAFVAIVVLGVTAALVQAAPEEASATGGGGPVETEVHGANVALDATVDPTAVGPVDIDLQVASHDGTPLEPEEITAELTLPERDLGPIDVELEPVGTGSYRSTGADIPFPGDWELEVTVRTTDIDQDRLTVPFSVG